MAHQCRQPIANGCVVGSKSTIGLIRGETLWVGASSSGVRGGRAAFGSSRRCRPRNTGRGHSYLRFIICSHSRVPSFYSVRRNFPTSQPPEFVLATPPSKHACLP